MQLPDNHGEFYSDIVNMARSLIKTGYWDGIEEEDLLLWLSNFRSDEEKFLASLVLRKITYRCNKAVESMFRQISQVVLPHILKRLDIYTISTIDSFLYSLEHDPWKLPFCFSTVEKKDPAASGGTILRHFQQSLPVHKNMLVSLREEIPERVKAIILLDDITGTGEQFDTFIKKHLDKKKQYKIIYIPLAAHREGLDRIDREHPECFVYPLETFDETDSFFQEDFTIHIESMTIQVNIEELKALYLELIKRTRIERASAFGRGDLSLLHFFQVSSPNNSLPILSYNADNWHRLVAR